MSLLIPIRQTVRWTSGGRRFADGLNGNILPSRTVRCLLIAAIFLIFFALHAAAADCPMPLPTTSITIGTHALTVELAATPESRQCGLSHRDSLPENHGMLFVYPQSTMMTFWMKDTHVPLSIAFLDEAGRIVSIQKMAPLDTGPRYHSPQPVRYALEVAQGWFETNGIRVGDHADLALPPMLNIR